jgi:feruloyl esterase
MLSASFRIFCVSVIAVFTCSAFGQHSDTCGDLASIKIPGAEITKAAVVPAGKANPPFGIGYDGPVPEYCRVDGVINRRTGVDGQQFGIGFAVGLPGNWNSDFLMQGGGGNGFIAEPIGGAAAGNTPALLRGFAVARTDTGHKGKAPFDFSFLKDEQAMLDFAYQANPKVAEVSKQIIARYYGKTRCLLLLCRMLDWRPGGNDSERGISYRV